MKKETSRQILARNLEQRMSRSPDLRSDNALGAKAKVAHSHIGRILRCESAATVDMLDKIADALGCHTWELLSDSEAVRQRAMAKMLFGEGPTPPPAQGADPTANVHNIKRRKQRE